MARLTLADVAAGVPQNSTAARVVGRGVHYERARKPLETGRVDVRASVDPIPVDPRRAQFGLHREMVGKRFGRWLVIGYAAQQPTGKNAKAAWVVKCACGRYETRTAKAIRRAPTSGDCCWECRSLQQSRRAYRELGSKPIEAFIAPRKEER